MKKVPFVPKPAELLHQQLLGVPGPTHLSEIEALVWGRDGNPADFPAPGVHHTDPELGRWSHPPSRIGPPGALDTRDPWGRAWTSSAPRRRRTGRRQSGPHRDSRPPGHWKAIRPCSRSTGSSDRPPGHGREGLRHGQRGSGPPLERSCSRLPRRPASAWAWRLRTSKKPSPSVWRSTQLPSGAN